MVQIHRTPTVNILIAEFKGEDRFCRQLFREMMNVGAMGERFHRFTEKVPVLLGRRSVLMIGNRAMLDDHAIAHAACGLRLERLAQQLQLMGLEYQTFIMQRNIGGHQP